MQFHRMLSAVLVFTAATSTAYGANIHKQIVVMADVVAPATALSEDMNHGAKTNKFGALVDFNFGDIAMGPEIWTGTFVVKGPADQKTYRRQDFWPGEQDKIEAIRLRWNISVWEIPESMRGWVVKFGYSFTNITSRSNRYFMTTGQGDARPTVVPNVEPADATQVITDRRHGLSLGFGNRWMFLDQSLAVEIGVSFTFNLTRTVNVDGKDPNARDNYNQMIEILPQTKMGTKPYPEASLAVGYAI